MLHPVVAHVLDTSVASPHFIKPLQCLCFRILSSLQLSLLLVENFPFHSTPLVKGLQLYSFLKAADLPNPYAMFSYNFFFLPLNILI